MPFNEKGKKQTACCNKKEQTVTKKIKKLFKFLV